MGPFIFPDIDPVALELGPLVIRWYALAYVSGLLFGWWYCMRLADRAPRVITRDQVDSFLTWCILGVIIGGRLGHVIFYYPAEYLADPVRILKVWEGGMAFHGGLLGVGAAMNLFARKHKLSFFWLSDLISAAVPIGIGLGRITNFINQELWGRATDVSWAVIFTRDPQRLPRHPSQLYEAVLEGFLLFAILFVLTHAFRARFRPGLLTGVFLTGYAAARGVSEFVREPEVLQATLPFGTTWGQWLSLPLGLIGLYFAWRALSKPALPAGGKKARA